MHSLGLFVSFRRYFGIFKVNFIAGISLNSIVVVVEINYLFILVFNKY